MKHRIPFLAMIALGVQPAAAQTAFTRIFDATDYFLPSAPFVLEAGNGDLLTILRCEGIGNNRRYRIVRTDANGNLIVSNDVKAVNSTNLSLRNVLELPNGSIALVGSYANTMSLVLVDANGQLINGHTYPSFTQSMAYTAALEGTDVVVLGGQFNRNGEIVPYVVRTALDGTLIAAEEHDGAGSNATAEHSLQAPDGGVYHVGASGDSVGGTYEYYKNILITRSDSSGAQAWGHLLLCEGQSIRAMGLEELPSGNVVVAGRHTPVGGVQSPFLMLLDPSGDPLWAQYYDVGDLNVQDVTMTTDKLIALTGYTGNTSKVMVLDTTGAVLDFYEMEESAYHHCSATSGGGLLLSAMGGFPLEQATGMARLDAGLGWLCSSTPLTVAGAPISFMAQSIGVDSVFALALAPQDFSSTLMNIAEPLNAYALCLSTGTDGKEVVHKSAVFPNPAAGAVTIEAGNIRALELLDVTGRVVRSVVLPAVTERTILDISDLATGVHLLRILDESGWHSERLIKE